MRWFAFALGLLPLLCSTAAASETSKRCTVYILRTFHACELSCKVLRHDTGVCTDEDFCLCSGDEYDFFGRVGDWIEEKLDVSTISAKMDEIYNEVKGKFKFSAVKEWLKPVTLSKCKIGGSSFCKRACHAIARVDGVCNRDLADCNCSEEQVSLEQFRYCASASFCRVKCQAEGKRTGRCTGKTGWDCECTDSFVDPSTLSPLYPGSFN